MTPDFESGYGVKLENTSGALPFSPGSSDENTFTWESMPGPDPTMMLSAMRVSVDIGTRDVHAALESRVERREPGQLRGEPALGRVVAVVDDDLVVRAGTGADDQVEDLSPFTSAIATEGVPSNDGNGVTNAITLSPLPSWTRTVAGLSFDPGTATAYVDTSGMTLMVIISPLSSWFSRWQWTT